MRELGGLVVCTVGGFGGGEEGGERRGGFKGGERGGGLWRMRLGVEGKNKGFTFDDCVGDRDEEQLCS